MKIAKSLRKLLAAAEGRRPRPPKFRKEFVETLAGGKYRRSLQFLLVHKQL